MHTIHLPFIHLINLQDTSSKSIRAFFIFFFNKKIIILAIFKSAVSSVD